MAKETPDDKPALPWMVEVDLDEDDDDDLEDPENPLNQDNRGRTIH